jgi:LPS-assembly protein
MKIFTMDRKWIKKMKHTVEPGLLYEYVPANDQRDFPSFDIPERLYRRHSIGYYVKNRFIGLIVDARGELEEREIGYLMLGQLFNISEPKGGMYLAGDAEEDFSDIFGEIRLGIFPRLYFKAKVSYNPYDNNLRYYSALINWNNIRGEFLEFEYRYARDRYEIFDIEAKIRLTGSLYAFFDARYDSLEDEDLDTEIGIDYSAQCWGSRISVESSGGTAGRVSDTSFNLLFYLKGLGGKL